jgi:hypothetical protein
MPLLDLWDYIRASGDRRLRKQGYANAGAGIAERYRRVTGFWAPHLERNRQNLRSIGEKLGERRGGTALILGAGRLLDVPWEELFPRFERVVLADADFSIVQHVERIVAASKVPNIPKPLFEIGDLTNSVVDTAAWAEQTIGSSSSLTVAVKSLADGFARADAVQPQWARTYADLRLVVSTNLLSQLGYFPRLHVQTEFRKRFKEELDAHPDASQALEKYFGRVRARHVCDMTLQKKAWLYLSADVEVVGYALESDQNILTQALDRNAGVELDASGNVKFNWPVKVLDRNDPLYGQRVKDLWPNKAGLQAPLRWAWHIVPQGSEKKYRDRGRVHIVEAWTRSPL